MPHLLDPRRSAHASIRGYLYQALLGVERWMRLGTDGEAADAILCEGDEDLDRLVRDGIVSSEQIKDYTGSLGIGDRVVRETLARYLLTWVELRKRGDDRRFVFTTTAPRRPPRAGIDILDLWHRPERRMETIDGVRAWLADSDDAAGTESAFSWLDENDAWADFFAAIDWGFDAPGFAETRDAIARQLADRGVPLALRETLINRLVARVLEASIKPEISKRVLTLAGRDQLLRATESELAEWAATPRAEQLRRTFDESKALDTLIDPAIEPLPPNAPPSFYLTARFEVIPFEKRGREGEISRLSLWCDARESGSVLLLHGGGGAGKTRLLIEWCRRLRHQGWHAGFLDRTASERDLKALFEGVAPRCLVIDYGETRTGLVEELLLRMNRHRTSRTNPKVRIALLARAQGAWWHQVQNDHQSVASLVLASPDPIEITPLVPEPAERHDYVAEVAAAYAAARGDRKPDRPPTVDYSRARYERVLYLHLEALLCVLGDERKAYSHDDPLDQILHHERRAWWPILRETAGIRAIPRDLRRSVDAGLAAVTLVGGARSEDEARSLISLAAPEICTDRRVALEELFHRLYTSSDRQSIGPLEPDLLGEELVRQALDRDLDLLDRVLDAVADRQVREALVVVGRLLDDERTSLDLAKRVLRRLESDHHRSIPLREAALSATLRVLDAHLAESTDRKDAQRSEQAGLLNKLGNRLSELGRMEEALNATLQAVEIFQDLHQEFPERFRHKLAGALTNLGTRLKSLGRLEEALDATREAVELLRIPTSHQSPDGFRYNLAASLNNLGLRLNELGRGEEALAPSREAVVAFGDLARTNPEAYEPDFAQSLSNLSSRLGELGHPEEALEAARRAVAVSRDLADRRPDAYWQLHARTLTNLGSQLSRLGTLEEAVDVTTEAVDLRRRLAQLQPDRFRPDLALSLTNLGSHLARLGRGRKALEALTEAVDIRRELAERRPTTFGSKLASSLSNQSECLRDLGLREEALKASEEAVRALSPSFLDTPNVFRLMMRSLIGDYQRCCEEIGAAPDLDLLDSLEAILGARSD